jgi:hypothetical protein
MEGRKMKAALHENKRRGFGDETAALVRTEKLERVLSGVYPVTFRGGL